MADDRRNADLLQVVGKYLDAQSARNFALTEQEGQFSLTWEVPGSPPGGGTDCQFELGDLVAAARVLRSRQPAWPRGEQAEWLHLLGQELDRHGITLGSIVHTANGYRVSGMQQGVPFTRRFAHEELHPLREEPPASRSAGERSAEASGAEGAPEAPPAQHGGARWLRPGRGWVAALGISLLMIALAWGVSFGPPTQTRFPLTSEDRSPPASTVGLPTTSPPRGTAPSIPGPSGPTAPETLIAELHQVPPDLTTATDPDEADVPTAPREPATEDELAAEAESARPFSVAPAPGEDEGSGSSAETESSEEEWGASAESELALVPSQAIVTARYGGARLRSAPSFRASIICILAPGTTVELLPDSFKTGFIGWVHARVGRVTGWIHSDTLR